MMFFLKGFRRQIHKQKVTKFELRKFQYFFPKVTKMGSIISRQYSLQWGRGFERPAAHTQQKLTQVTLRVGTRVLMQQGWLLEIGRLLERSWFVDVQSNCFFQSNRFFHMNANNTYNSGDSKHNTNFYAPFMVF